MWLIKDLMCESDVSEVLWGELLHFCQLEACLFPSFLNEETVLFYAFLMFHCVIRKEMRDFLSKFPLTAISPAPVAIALSQWSVA